MKTQIIQINKYDDHISVCDKMNWSKTRRILLIWPINDLVLNQQLDLILIQRRAKLLGAQLAFVTHDADIRFLAKKLKIPVFKNLRQAQHTQWRVDMKIKIRLNPGHTDYNLETIRKLINSQSQELMNHPSIRILSFSISVLALFVLGIFILPSATIYLAPEERTQSFTISVNADPSLTTVNLSTGSVPTYIKEVVVEGRESVQTTGTTIIPDQVAIGELLFKNITNHDISLPKGTIVTTMGNNPIRYISSAKDEVTIQAGGSALISARSIKPGTSGNLPLNSLVTIEGALGSEVIVTNPYPTHGGTDASVPAPTNQDVRFLRERLVSALEVAAIRELNTIIPAEDILITPTVKIIDIIEESPTPSVGAPGKMLDFSMRLRFQSQVVAAEQLLKLVTSTLEGNTPTGYSPVEDSLSLSEISAPILLENGTVDWTMIAQRKLHAEIAIEQAIPQIKGLSLTQAVAYLNDFLPLASQARIMIAPYWWPKLPLLPMRIQVVEAETQ